MLFAGIKVILQMVFFGIFLYVYGFPALEKLNEQNTIVVTTHKRDASAFNNYCGKKPGQWIRLEEKGGLFKT